MSILTLSDYFGRGSRFATENELTPELRDNAVILLERVNGLLARLPDIPAAVQPHVNSGWRPSTYNSTIPGAAVKSKHITAQAIDLADPEGELDEFLFANQQYLIDAGLWLEHPLASKNWTHLQSVPPRSGNRVFFP